jgi:Uma2 family endonuclease
MPDDAGFVLDMRAAAPAVHRFTVEEVRGLAAAGVLSPDARVELLDGELYGMPSEGELHRDFKIEIGRFFIRALPDELRAAMDTTLVLSADEAPEPDLYVFDADARTEPMDVSRLHLVVEVSDTSLQHDLAHKARRYASWGIVEYWVVDVYGRCTHVHRRPSDGRYPPPGTVSFEAPLRCLRLPDLPLVIAELPRLSRFGA